MFISDGKPPEGLGPSDLAGQLLVDMRVGRSQPNMLAASEALFIKGSQPKFDVRSAYNFILKRWEQYKKSAHFKSQFRRKVSDWLTEGDYDNPASWGDAPDLAFQESTRKVEQGPKEWEAERRANPENYVRFDLDGEISKLAKLKELK